MGKEGQMMATHGCISYTVANVSEVTSCCKECLNLIYIKSVIILIIAKLFFVSYFLIVKISHYLLVFKVFLERHLMFISQPK